MNVVLTHSVTFLTGAFIGAAAVYYGNLFTDQRRRKEQKRDASKKLKSISQTMPDLLREMQSDLCSEGMGNVREFFVCGKKNIVNSSKPRFSYYHEEHQGLLNKMEVLENLGYIIDVTPGNCPIYRMTEAFVSGLKEINL